MKIDSIETIPYNLTMKESFITSKNTYSNREGYIIKVASNEFVGFGDVCPLPKFNCENIKDTLYGLEKFKSAVLGVGELDENDIIEMIEIYLNGLPSCQFGLNTAIIDLRSKIVGIPFAKYLNKNYRNTIYSNGMESLHKPKDNFSVIKVKVGFRNLFDELEYLEYLKNKYGKNIKFRLDVNENFDLPRAIRFCKEV